MRSKVRESESTMSMMAEKMTDVSAESCEADPLFIFSMAEKRSRRITALAVFLSIAAVCLSLWIGSWHKIGGFDVETDFYGWYARQADNILNSEAYTYLINPPGYMVLLALTYPFTGDYFVAGKVLSALSLGFLAWFTFLLLKELFEDRLAFATTVIMTIALLPFSFLAAMDLVGAASFVFALWVTLRKPALRMRDCAVAGIAAGAAYLIRYQYIFAIAGLAAAVPFLAARNERTAWRVKKLAAFILNVIFVVSPWLIYNTHKNGSPFASIVLVQVAANFHHPLGDAYRTSINETAAQFHTWKDVLFHAPWSMLTQYVSAVGYTRILKLAEDALTFPAYLFAGAGFLLLLKNLTRRRLVLIGVTFLGFALMGLTGYYLRYYLFLYPLLFLAVTYGIFFGNPWEERRRYFSATALSWFIFIAVTGIICLRSYRSTRDIIASEPRYISEAAEILKLHARSGDRIVTRKPHIAFLAGIQDVVPMVSGADALIRTAKSEGARFIAYSDFEARLWPGLKELGDPENVPSELKLIYRHAPSNTLIYELADGVKS